MTLAAWDLFLRVSYLGFALLLLALATSAYRRYREGRFVALVSAFAVLAVEGGVFLLPAFSAMPLFWVPGEVVLLHLVALVLLYLAVIRR